jgi:hypothetical protein
MPPAPQQTAPSASDIVRLHNGAEYRGTIAERVPDSHVVILTMVGDTRRFEWAEVAYAGPLQAPIASPDAPAPSPRAPSAQSADTPASSATGTAPPLADSVSVDLRGFPAGVTWMAQHQQSGEGARALCMPPCKAELPKGPYRFGLKVPGRKTAWSPSTFALEEPDIFEGSYDSRRGSRIAGGIVLGGSLATAIALIAVGAQSKQTCTASTSSAYSGASDVCESSVSTPIIASGLVLGLVGGVIGVVLMSKKDRSNVSAARSKRIPTSARRADQPARKASEKYNDQPIELPPKFQTRAWQCLPADTSSLAIPAETDASGTLVFVAPPAYLKPEERRCLREALRGIRTNSPKADGTIHLSR